MPDLGTLLNPLPSDTYRYSPANEYQSGLAFLFCFFFYLAFLETDREAGVTKRKSGKDGMCELGSGVNKRPGQFTQRIITPS